ncbi:E3 ubiquitin-protein ligase TRAIP-like [Mytilus edulis]|uniref:E3 ubiquitin-protein ligase TRAIP-like n=1 Tax=Mytilus edulis TaxID=6550 RepID=UPI0039F0F152
MKAQCSICTDLFESDNTISALPCGHTFHENCINQWLKNANTCPSCRVPVERGKVIKKLFFDKGDDEGIDESKLSNENNNLKAKLREKDCEREKFDDEKQTLQSKINNLEKEIKNQDVKIKEKQTTVSSMKKELQYFQAQQKSLEVERDECRKAKRKMIELQNVQILLTGCETDVQELLETRTNSDGSVKELAKYCAILKSEFEQLKSSRKAIKIEYDKFKRDFISKDTKLKDSLKELSYLRDVSKKSEEDLQKAEKHNDHLQKKVSKLQNLLKSPKANGNDSFIETVTQASPMISTPVLTNFSHNIVSESPELVKPSPNTQLRNHCQENNIKVMKITSVSSQPPAKKQKCDDVNTLGNLNIFKKKSGLGDMKSAIRKGYDGLGGHTTFTERQMKPKLAMKKSISRTMDIRKGMMARVPKLPSLDNFVTID